MIPLNDHLTVSVFNIFTGETSCNSVFQAFDGFLAIHEGFHSNARNLIPTLTAVCLANDQLLRYIHHTSGQVSGIGCTQRRVGKSLTCAVGGHKVFQYVQAFTEIGLNGQLNRPACRIRHHTSQLFDLLIGSTGSGIRHHIDVIILIQTGQKHLRQFFIRLIPCLNNCTVPLLFRDQATPEIHGNLIHRSLCLFQHLCLSCGHSHIGNRYGHRSSGRIFIPCGFDQVQHLCRSYRTMNIDYLLQYLL